MSGSYLLDTNIVIALFADDPAVVGALGSALTTFVPTIVLGELYYGAYRSGRQQANLERVTHFARASALLNCDAETARVYGEVKQRLSDRGRPIPENDVWIAALAQQHGLTLVTRDSHFSEVETMTIERW